MRLNGMAYLGLVLSLAACGETSPKKAQDGRECSCNGATCGVDNCGQSCGSCGDTDFCAEGTCVSADGCDLVGFEMTTTAGFARFAGGQTRVRFIASNVETEPPFDKLVFELNHDRFFEGGTPAPGTFGLEGASDPTSPLYLRGFTYCNDFDCAFPYIVEGGSLELEEPGVPGGHLRGWLRGLKLKQVRVDPNSGEDLPFSNGKLWCAGDLRLDAEIPPLPTAQGVCVADGTGNKVGDNVRNFTMTNCLGEQVDMHDRCGKSEAVWFIATAGWCGACEAFVPEAAKRQKELADEGLDLVVVIGENAAGGAPSLEYCKDYAGSKGLDPASTFIDHDGTNSWPTLFGAIDTYSGGSIGLPWNAVVDGRSFEYVWSSNAGSGDLYSVQDALMARE
jgi:hypothetical protein